MFELAMNAKSLKNLVIKENVLGWTTIIDLQNAQLLVCYALNTVTVTIRAGLIYKI